MWLFMGQCQFFKWECGNLAQSQVSVSSSLRQVYNTVLIARIVSQIGVVRYCPLWAHFSSLSQESPSIAFIQKSAVSHKIGVLVYQHAVAFATMLAVLL